MNILTDFIPPMLKFSIATREFISEKLYVKKNILANKYSRKLFSLTLAFNFTFHLAFNHIIFFLQFLICSEKMLARHLSKFAVVFSL